MRIAFAFVFATVIGCGGSVEGPKSPTPGDTGGSAAAKTNGPDLSIEIPPGPIHGMQFQPAALDRPDMRLYEPKKKTTIDKQRDVFAKTKDPVQKEAQAAILATLLYQQSKEVKDDPGKQKIWGDARQVLRDAAQVSGDKVDEITLALLGRYELMLDDYAAAEKAWATLIAKAPKDKELSSFKTWYAFSLLKQYKNAEALAVVKDQPGTDAEPELAYVTAWAKFRAGDEAGAWQAILAAAKGWKDRPRREAVDRDVALFAGRTNVSMTDALPALFAIYARGSDDNAKAKQYEVVAKLGLQSYQYAGRWADGVAAIDKAIAIIGAKVPLNDLPVLRYQQADYTVRLDDPVTSAKFAKQALEALPPCGTKCSDKDKENIVESVYILGRLFHILYATANDVRFYEPAHDLYQASIPLISMNDTLRAQAQKDATFLEGSFKSMKHDTGTHDKDAIGALLHRHDQEVQACYEVGLAGNPKLGGSLVLNLEAEQSGAIKGASTDPKAGMADLSAVAGCVAERAKAWRLPKRGQAGSTRIKLTYQMSPRKDAAAK